MHILLQSIMMVIQWQLLAMALTFVIQVNTIS